MVVIANHTHCTELRVRRYDAPAARPATIPSGNRSTVGGLVSVIVVLLFYIYSYILLVMSDKSIKGSTDTSSPPVTVRII